jgi:hypothetical protein
MLLSKIQFLHFLQQKHLVWLQNHRVFAGTFDKIILTAVFIAVTSAANNTTLILFSDKFDIG